MKLKTLALLIIASVILTACGGGKSSTRQYTDFSETDYQIASVGDLTLHMPSKYKFTDSSYDADGATCELYSYRMGHVKYLVSYLPIAPKYDLFSDEFKESTISVYQESSGSFEMKEYKKIKVAGTDALRMDYVKTEDGETSYCAEVTIFEEDCSYIIQLIDSNGSSSAFLDDFQGILDSAKMG